MKKTIAQIAPQIALAAVLILLAVTLVTCEDFLPGFGKDDDAVEYLDWQYEEEPSGMGKLTLTLDGSRPFAHKTKGRGLNVEMAKMAHDYFEVVFVNTATVATDVVSAAGSVARAAWEIGEPAGISGVKRGADYGPVFPANNGHASVIFVGKKTGKTLLGIGHLIEVKEDDTPVTSPTATTITEAATSVTFAVSPFRTNVGWYDHDGQASSDEILRGSSTDPDELIKYPEVTFLTATTSKTEPGHLTGPDVAKTIGGNIALRGGVSYPLYTLPDAEVITTGGPLPTPIVTTGRTIEATYKITGMKPTTMSTLNTAARIYGTPPPTGAPVGTLGIGLQIIKRTPRYVTGGQTFEASSGGVDTYTTVENTTHLYADRDKAFEDIIKMTFTQTKQSGGLFAITFQCPVYAITTAASSNNGPKKYEKWYIRPGYQQFQYLLDNGVDAGGMVFLGTNAGGVDWLDIYTTGIGFDN